MIISIFYLLNSPPSQNAHPVQCPIHSKMTRNTKLSNPTWVCRWLHECQRATFTFRRKRFLRRVSTEWNELFEIRHFVECISAGLAFTMVAHKVCVKILARCCMAFQPFSYEDWKQKCPNDFSVQNNHLAFDMNSYFSPLPSENDGMAAFTIVPLKLSNTNIICTEFGIKNRRFIESLGIFWNSFRSLLNELK